MSVILEGRHVAIVVAHPDDETVGAGGCLPLLPAPVFIHVTDGAPRDMRDASANGFATREDYAEARRLEFLDALRAGGVEPAYVACLGIVDQEAALNLVDLTRELARLLRRLNVDLVLVHPYEGGHPDHDATAFAVHAACRSFSPSHRPQIVEFTSYHTRGGEMETGVFLPNSGPPGIAVKLNSDARLRKQHMFECYRTQQPVLRQFKTAEERFRPAPVYDFAAPPHDGQLFYEQFSWGMTADRWSALARTAEDALGLC